MARDYLHSKHEASVVTRFSKLWKMRDAAVMFRCWADNVAEIAISQGVARFVAHIQRDAPRHYVRQWRQFGDERVLATDVLRSV